MGLMNSVENRKFNQALDKIGEQYDAKVTMLKRAHSKSYNYHSKLRGGHVHPVRETLAYAVALLDSGKEDNLNRALDIIGNILVLQDDDPESPTYGIWPYYFEESIEEMGAPDFNWADFCGKKLLHILIAHEEVLPKKLYEAIRTAVKHACYAIMHRNIGPDYTNISIMGAYVTLVYGERFGDQVFFEYGKKRLETLYDYNCYHGAFTEFNSPTYNIVAVEDLARMLKNVQDPQCLKWIEHLYREFGWKSIAQHFHPPTRQWAGPHSRSYNNLVQTSILSKIQMATKNAVSFFNTEELILGIDWPQIGLWCPEEFIHYFQAINEERFIQQVYHLQDHRLRTLIATTYLTADYSLGSIFQSELWNQRRPLIAYWGDVVNPVYLQFRCLHDDYDYVSAVLHTVQNEGDLLGIVNFVTNGGDKHTTLDPVKNATISANDLRCRFEFGGAINDLKMKHVSDKEQYILHCTSANVEIIIGIPYCQFDNKVEFVFGKNDEIAYFDIVFYSGEERSICFSDIQEAICSFAVSIRSIGNQIADLSSIKFNKDQENLFLEWETGSQTLAIQGSLKPKMFKEIYKGGKAMINGKDLEEIAKK